jgi:hypothetical protein
MSASFMAACNNSSFLAWEGLRLIYSATMLGAFTAFKAVLTWH